jgi:hypothetical protein
MTTYTDAASEAQAKTQVMMLELMQAMTKASIAFQKNDLAEAAMSMRDASGVLKKLAAEFDKTADEIQEELGKREKDN